MIPIATPYLDGKEKELLNKAIDSGWISSKGEFIQRFEEGFSRYCGTRYGVAVSNGTVALHLALLAVGIGRGDEVIVPTFTFAATANAVLYAGATPVFVDCGEDDWNMDPALVAKAVTRRTRAVIPVHVYGNPCDMEALRTVARRRGLVIVEDCAEAHGAYHAARKVGSFGAVSCFSFYGNKILTTGEGGMCLTDDGALYRKMRILRDHGMDVRRRYWHNVVGYNYRLTNVQAAIGCAQLAKIDRILERKGRIASWYQEGLSELADQGLLKLHQPAEGTRSVYWLFGVVLSRKFGLTRDRLMKGLYSRGIETRPFFNPLHLMPPYRRYVRAGRSFPVAERISRYGLSLPSSPSLDEKDVAGICESIRTLREAYP